METAAFNAPAPLPAPTAEAQPPPFTYRAKEETTTTTSARREPPSSTAASGGGAGLEHTARAAASALYEQLPYAWRYTLGSGECYTGSGGRARGSTEPGG
jgi:hypothetical protein